MYLIIKSLTIIYMQENGIWNVIGGCYMGGSCNKSGFPKNVRYNIKNELLSNQF